VRDADAAYAAVLGEQGGVDEQFGYLVRGAGPAHRAQGQPGDRRALDRHLR
jgi:hypothetical protein